MLLGNRGGLGEMGNVDNSVPNIAPTMFIMAAINRADLGRIERVETQVAMALAASWKPLVKSKTKAITTTILTSTKVVSTI